MLLRRIAAVVAVLATTLMTAPIAAADTTSTGGAQTSSPAAAAPAQSSTAKTPDFRPAPGCFKEDGTLDPSCRSIQVSPARLTMTPDEVQNHVEREFAVYNGGTVNMPLTVSAVEFTQSRSGATQLGDTKHPGESSKWVRITPTTLTLAPGQKAKVTVQMFAPTNASAGDHNLSIVFRGPAVDTDSGLSVVPSVAGQLIAQLPGKVVRDVQLTAATAKSNFLGVMQSGTDHLFTVDVANKGTVYESFRAEDRLTGTVTGTGAPAGAVIDAAEFDVMRGATREATVVWGEGSVRDGYAATAPPAFCLCKVTFATSDGHGGTTTQTVSFIIFPVWQTIVALILLALSVVYIVVKRRRRRAGRHHATAAPSGGSD